MKVTALLTGRGNNTLKDKNVLDILGKPVMYYPGKAGLQAKTVDEYFCSSDDEKILNYANEMGYQEIKRPLEIARPNSQHIECILHGLQVIENVDMLPDILVVILANNVTIKSGWIDDCVKIMENDMSIDSVVPVYMDLDHHPLRAKSLNNDGTLSMYIPSNGKKISTNRQDLPTCYFLSHNFWVLNVKNMLKNNGKGQPPWSFMGDKIIPYEVDHSIDIHEEIDLYIAKEWIIEHYTD